MSARVALAAAAMSTRVALAAVAMSTRVALAAVAMLAGCDSCKPLDFGNPQTGSAGDLDFKLPASATDVRIETKSSLRDATVYATFSVPVERSAELLAALPCAPQPDTCTSKKFHTEERIELHRVDDEITVVVDANVYDQCLFEGCH